jgi:hypothetical protein
MLKKNSSQKKIGKRLTNKIHNLEKLYRVSEESHELKDEIIEVQSKQIAKMKELDTNQQQLIEAQAKLIVELEAIVFGKKKKPPDSKSSKEKSA